MLFHPGAGRAEKAWGEERFAHLARGLIRERGIAPIVSWGPGDERRAERLRALLPKRAPMPLLDFAGLARVIRASALFVAGDTGPLHLADALGVPTLALFGPTDSRAQRALPGPPRRRHAHARRVGRHRARAGACGRCLQPPLTLCGLNPYHLPHSMAVKLGDLLLKQKLITQDQLDTALKLQREEGGKIGEALVRVGAVSEGDITETLSQQFGVPSIDLAHFEIDPAVIKVVPGEVARKYGVLPVNKTGATLTIAMGDPTNVFAMDDIKFMTGYNVEPVVASEIALRKAIDKHYGTPRSVVLKETHEVVAGRQPFSTERASTTSWRPRR